MQDEDSVQPGGRLNITLWDFTWYTRTGPGEPFEDLDAAFAAASVRGYNAVRICAMPLLLASDRLRSAPLTLEPLGGDFGQRTRWYDVRTRTTIDPVTHTLSFFAAAYRHGFRVIVSSWEYQQSPAFSADRRWYDEVSAIPPAERVDRLARAHAELITLLKHEELQDTVAFVELHNEVQYTRLTEGVSGEPLRALKGRFEAGIDTFCGIHPDVLCTVNVAHVPLGLMADLPSNLQVAVFHPYLNGVLEQMQRTFALRSSDAFPQREVRNALLRDGAPDLQEWGPGAGNEWKLQATVVGRELYVHDWCDPEAFDRWLYERYASWAPLMHERLQNWMLAASDFARARGVPLVFGEGWVGYTPALGRFEEDAVGREWCREAARLAHQIGAWGTVVCSNAAPHHSMWADVDLQQECLRLFAGGDAVRALGAR